MLTAATTPRRPPRRQPSLIRRSAGAHFDIAAFWRDLDAVRHANGLCWIDAARATGVAPSTLSRMATGRRPDLDGAAALAAWADLRLDNYVRAVPSTEAAS